MINYTGCICTECGRAFEEKDDVVVCPVCGTPQHRECYKKENKCINEALHEEGFVYKNEFSDNAATGGELPESKCIQCGAVIGSESKVCPNCGCPAQSEPSDDYGHQLGQPITLPFGDTEEINGVKVGELKRFIGSGWPLYIPSFLSMKRRKSVFSFSFAALLGNWVWLLMRKMYFGGILYFAALAFIILFRACYGQYAVELFGTENITAEQIIGSNNLFITLGYLASFFLTIGQYVLMLICAVFGNRMYMNHCVRTIKRIKKKYKSESDIADRIESRGGVSVPVLIFSGAMLALLYFSTTNGWFDGVIKWLTDLLFMIFPA